LIDLKNKSKENTKNAYIFAVLVNGEVFEVANC